MRRRGAAVILGGVMTVVLSFTGSAAAATVVGSNCAASTTEGTVSIVSLKAPAGYPIPNAIPGAGVITSWSYSVAGVLPAELDVTTKLKVFAPAATPGQFKVVGESPATIQGGTTATPARIPVQSGDLLGSSLTVLDKGGTEQGALFCNTGNPEDEIGVIPGDPVSGSTVSIVGTKPGYQNPITVTVEPDADGDGYGDETQDKCPTDASTHEACPAPKAAPTPPPPPAPITLSDSASAKKGLVTVSLTSSAQATVTVAGTVKLGKGKSVKLSGGTQIVAPGSLAKFTVVFPAKLRAALKQLPSGKKLPVLLSATAPGATTKTLTVKVPGQKRLTPSHHRHVS
jgi:hypothetical protein